MSSFSDGYAVRTRTWQVGASRSSASWRIVWSVKMTLGRRKSAGSFMRSSRFPQPANRHKQSTRASGGQMHFDRSEAFENRSRALTGLDEIQSGVRPRSHHLARTHADRTTKIIDEVDSRQQRI